MAPNPSFPLYHIRNLNPETDYPALSALYAAIEAADHLGAATSEAALQAAGPERRRWVAEHTGASGQFLAHGWLHPRSADSRYFFAGVHPDWRRQGLGSAMFAYGAALAKEQGVQQLVCIPRSDYPAAPGFLQHHGFRVMGHNRFMKATANLSQGEPHWPAGFTVRTFAETGDVVQLVAAHNLCYAGHWGHHEYDAVLTVEELQGWMKAYPDSFIPEGIFLLFDPSGELAGLTYGRLSSDNGPDAPKTRIVDSPGVAPKYRHLDLLRPLTLHTLQWLRTQGEGGLELHCFGEDEETAAVYTGLGFALTPDRHSIEYLRLL